LSFVRSIERGAMLTAPLINDNLLGNDAGSPAAASKGVLRIACTGRKELPRMHGLAHV
jgi:hypothetical protein